MGPSPAAVRLASRLRDLRESHGLTQMQLARALSDEARVAIATISSWESLSNPKLPAEERLRSYALFFSRTEDAAKVPREHELNSDERTRFATLHHELVGLRDAVRHEVPGANVPSGFTNSRAGG
jgi:transcriptional regulator with XRE-family HTH domain